MKDPPHRSPGFTLIEAMVIVATIGILMAFSAATYRRIAGEEPPHNAAKDLAEAIERARTVARERKNDVWVIVYQGFNKRANTVTAGRGAWFVIEDAGHDFNAQTGSVPNVYYRSGVGKEFDPVAKTFEGPNAKLLEKAYLDDYAGRLRFRLPSNRLELGPSEAPFAGLALTVACTFCTTGSRGAIVFSPDGSLRFVDGAGDEVKGDRHALTMISDRNKHTSVIGLSRTGEVGLYRK